MCTASSKESKFNVVQPDEANEGDKADAQSSRILTSGGQNEAQAYATAELSDPSNSNVHPCFFSSVVRTLCTRVSVHAVGSVHHAEVKLAFELQVL